MKTAFPYRLFPVDRHLAYVSATTITGKLSGIMKEHTDDFKGN